MQGGNVWYSKQLLMRMRQPSTVDNVALQGGCFVQDDDAG